KRIQFIGISRSRKDVSVWPDNNDLDSVLAQPVRKQASVFLKKENSVMFFVQNVRRDDHALAPNVFPKPQRCWRHPAYGVLRSSHNGKLRRQKIIEAGDPISRKPDAGLHKETAGEYRALGDNAIGKIGNEFLAIGLRLPGGQLGTQACITRNSGVQIELTN